MTKASSTRAPGWHVFVGAFFLFATASGTERSIAQRASNHIAAPPSHTSPIFGVAAPSGFRDWRLISVAREDGDLNDLRAILGNDLAIKTFRDGAAPFPDGTIIVRLAWTYVSSDQNNAVFGRVQSFIAGSPTAGYLQLMVKDSKRYASTGGWGFAQFDESGNPADEGHHKACFTCHSRPSQEAATARDFVFTRYAR